ncbi:MAG TPA: trypsin-like peptidase domain-containing protein [Candidatus Paceibacterota bacterium]
MTYEEEVMQAVEHILPSVVSIVISRHAHLVGPTLPFKGVEQQNAQTGEGLDVKIGGGSGFIVSDDGLVLTNKHVIMEPDANYTIFDQNGDKSDVQVLARDPIHDVAILKMIPPKHFRIAPLGNSHTLRLGQTVIAIGNALGEFRSSVSTGVVSGLSRLITAVSDLSGQQERLRGLIQTDAAINPGNSGGPLINTRGEVIGINAAVVFGAQNIGFAIPIEKATKDLEDIKQFGRIRRPFIGIRYLIINAELQKQLRLPLDYGALVVREPIPGDHAVVPGSPAEKAGIKEGDLVIACNNHAITEKNSLEDYLENTKPGGKISLTVLRNGEKHSLALELKEWK